MTGKADFYAKGQWNYYCDLCGAKVKSGDSMKTWNGLYVCKHHKEVRNPQDFLRGVKENMSLPWTRPKPTDTFAPTTYTRSFNESIAVVELEAASVVHPVPGIGQFVNLSPVNGWGLNDLALNGSKQVPTISYAAESVAVSESANIAPIDYFFEASATVENFSMNHIVGSFTTVNGAALNKHTLG